MGNRTASGGPDVPPTRADARRGGAAPPPPGRRSIPPWAPVGLLALTLLLAAVLGWWLWASPEPVAPGAGQTAGEGGAQAATAPVELRDIRFFESEVSPNTLYVVGELVNVGTAAVAVPSAKITMFDAGKAALDLTSCAAPGVYDLQPSEKVPCKAVLTKAAGWKSYQVMMEVGHDDIGRRAAELKIGEVKTTAPKRRYAPHVVTGTVTNQSSFTAKQVWLFVGLYDADGKIVAAERTPVAGGELEPGASSTFSASIFAVAGKPTKSLTKVFGYDK